VAIDWHVPHSSPRVNHACNLAARMCMQVDEIKHNLPLELDFNHEMANAERCRRNLSSAKSSVAKRCGCCLAVSRGYCCRCCVRLLCARAGNLLIMYDTIAMCLLNSEVRLPPNCTKAWPACRRAISAPNAPCQNAASYPHTCPALSAPLGLAAAACMCLMWTRSSPVRVC
jgi:hypothetical protein